MTTDVEERVMCISLWQPWASLCCVKHPEYTDKSVKQFETRSWPTRHRGPLLIHAAKRFRNEERLWCYEDLIYEALCEHYFVGLPEVVPGSIPTGAIIGRVELTGCHPTEVVRGVIDKYALAMGDYSDARYAWEIVRPVLFDEPIPYRGQQGLFSVPSDVLPAAV